MYSIEYYWAIKRNKSESVELRWMSQECIIQSEVSQIEENKYRILMHIMESRKTVLMTLIVGQDVRDVENIPVDTVGEGEGVMNWESIIDIYTLPYVKQIASEKFLHNTGCSLQSRGVGGDICLLWLIHADLWQKPIQYCKAIILQLKKKILKLSVKQVILGSM